MLVSSNGQETTKKTKMQYSYTIFVYARIIKSSLKLAKKQKNDSFSLRKSRISVIMWMKSVIIQNLANLWKDYLWLMNRNVEWR